MPVVTRLAGRGHRAPHAADAALAVGHGAFLLAPGGGRQQQVGEGGGGGGGEGLLHHDELAAAQRLAHQRLVGHRLGGVGAGYPQGLDLAFGRGLEHLHRAFARLLGNARHAPEGGHLGAVRRVGQVAVGGQQIAQAAHLAPAHRIGLAGERKRPGAGAADLPGGQVQVDQGCILGGAAGALVQALAIQRQGGAAAFARRIEPGKPGGSLQQGLFGQAGQATGFTRGELGHPHAQRLEAVGVGVDVVAGYPAFGQHQVQQAVVQRHVAAGQQRQVQVGGACGVGAPRVGHDEAQPRVGAPGVFDATEQDGVRPGGVGTGDEEGARMGQVFIAGGRRIGTQRGLVAGHRAAHAQARIGVDVVGADQRLGQLVKDVVVLRQQLAREVKAHRVGAMGADGLLEAVGGQGHGLVPAHRLRRRVALAAPHRKQQPRMLGDGGAGRQVQGAALAAQAAEVGGMLRVAAHAGDLLALRFDDHAAAHAAVTAGGSGLARSGHASVLLPKINWSRMSPMSRPSRSRSKYQAPSAVSPYRQAPTSLLSWITSFL